MVMRNTMWQIRIHGRGGQGVVTAAELLAMAAFMDGKYAQALSELRVGTDGSTGCGVLPRR
jgi:Pyruvate/2-oxoacid:ferredoxin oxidoreductase gamma subunit